MGKQALTLVFELGSIDVASILRGIEDAPARSGAKFGPVKLDGQTEKDFESVVQQVRKRNLRAFNLVWHPYEFEFGQVTNSKFQFLLINSVQQSEISWDDWADPFVARPGFVMGWGSRYRIPVLAKCARSAGVQGGW